MFTFGDETLSNHKRKRSVKHSSPAAHALPLEAGSTEALVSDCALRAGLALQLSGRVHHRLGLQSTGTTALERLWSSGARQRRLAGGVLDPPPHAPLDLCPLDPPSYPLDLPPPAGPATAHACAAWDAGPGPAPGSPPFLQAHSSERPCSHVARLRCLRRSDEMKYECAPWDLR